MNRLADIRSMSRRLSDVILHLTMGYLGLAAVGKLADTGQFLNQLSLVGLPRQIAPTAAVAVPFSELALASAWFFSVRRHAAVAGAGVLLFAFAVVSAIRLARGDYAPCGCLGALERTQLGRALAGDTVLKSTIMLASCVMWMLLSWRECREGDREKL